MHIFDFCKGLPRKSFAKGEIILKEGEQTGCLYILTEGWVEISHRGMLLNKVSESGSIFGEVSALLNAPHMATVKSLEKSDFYVIEDAQAFIRRNSDVSLLLAKLLAQRLISITTNLSGLRQSLDTLMKQQTIRPVSLRAEAGSVDSPMVLSCGILEKSRDKILHRSE